MGKPHGISGEVYVMPISDDPHRFDAGARLLRSDGTVVVVESSRRHAERFLVKFEGVDTRAAAEHLRGALYVKSSSLRALDEDEYWQHDIAGCAVLDPAGEPLGTVVRVQTGVAHDHLVVQTAAGERLVPAVKEIVVEVDVGAGRVVVDAPAGLLD